MGLFSNIEHSNPTIYLGRNIRKRGCPKIFNRILTRNIFSIFFIFVHSQKKVDKPANFTQRRWRKWRWREEAAMLAASPNSNFHVPLSELRVSSSKKFKILYNFSPVNCFPPSKIFHFSSILPSNVLNRTPRTRKTRSRSSEGSRSLCNKFPIVACLAAEPDIHSADAPQHHFAPYSIRIPVGDRHVSVIREFRSSFLGNWLIMETRWLFGFCGREAEPIIFLQTSSVMMVFGDAEMVAVY